MNSLVLMSGSATACWALLVSFKVTLKVDGQWIQLNGLQVKGWHKCGSPQPTAQIETDGTITFPDNSPGTGIHELTLEFTTVNNVQSIRLDVYEKRDPSIILREIIPGFIDQEKGCCFDQWPIEQCETAKQSGECGESQIANNCLKTCGWCCDSIENIVHTDFSGCTNSSANNDFDCFKAIDGNMGAYGWFLISFPAWGIFELTDEIKMDSLILMSGKSATGNTYGYLISFKVMMKVNGQWINLSALQVKEDPQAQIANDGTVTLNSAISNLTLEFTTLTNVQSIRLDVNKTEDSKQQWIREIIPGFTDWSNCCWDQYELFSPGHDLSSTFDCISELECYQYTYDCAIIKAKGQCHLFPDKCTKTCEHCENNTTTTPSFDTTTNEITTETPSGDCETVECSQILDSNNNPYQCRPEKEALLWHKKCLPQDDAKCRYNGPPVDDCTWTGWIDNDNPLRHCDCESPPDGCLVQDYQIKDISTGTIYNDVNDPTLTEILVAHTNGIACYNRDQPDCQHELNGEVLPPGPIADECCNDYKVRFCCGPPKPKCFCCPPRDPPSDCLSSGCNEEFNGLGTCVNIDNPDIGEMEQLFDLDEPSLPGLCNKTVDESCCTCLKKKTCRDTGCSSRFGGEGICVDMVDGGVAKHDLDKTVQPDNTPGLCTNDVNSNCCTCYKKSPMDPGCFKIPCFYNGLDGFCVGRNDPKPTNGFIETSMKCDEEGQCTCWIPCKDTWKSNKCKKNCQKKNKCHTPDCIENCCSTCSA